VVDRWVTVTWWSTSVRRRVSGRSASARRPRRCHPRPRCPDTNTRSWRRRTFSHPASTTLRRMTSAARGTLRRRRPPRGVCLRSPSTFQAPPPRSDADSATEMMADCLQCWVFSLSPFPKCIIIMCLSCHVFFATYCGME